MEIKDILKSSFHYIFLLFSIAFFAFAINVRFGSNGHDCHDHPGHHEHIESVDSLSVDQSCMMTHEDSLFADYADAAQSYLNRSIFAGSPMTGWMMADCARHAYYLTGILVPVELALSQAQWESHMGLRGLSPRENPYNIGEYDDGTVLHFESTEEGVLAYYMLMTHNYLNCRDVDQLFENFVNCSGYRYASSAYEDMIGPQYTYIQKYIETDPMS